MIDKRHYKMVFKEFNFSYTIRVYKGQILYVADILECEGYRTKHFTTMDDALNAAREKVNSLIAAKQ